MPPVSRGGGARALLLSCERMSDMPPRVFSYPRVADPAYERLWSAEELWKPRTPLIFLGKRAERQWCLAVGRSALHGESPNPQKEGVL